MLTRLKNKNKKQGFWRQRCNKFTFPEIELKHFILIKGFYFKQICFTLDFLITICINFTFQILIENVIRHVLVICEGITPI